MDDIIMDTPLLPSTAHVLLPQDYSRLKVYTVMLVTVTNHGALLLSQASQPLLVK